MVKACELSVNQQYILPADLSVMKVRPQLSGLPFGEKRPASKATVALLRSYVASYEGFHPISITIPGQSRNNRRVSQTTAYIFSYGTGYVNPEKLFLAVKPQYLGPITAYNPEDNRT